MQTVLLKAAAFVLLIALGIVLRKKKLFTSEAADVLSKISVTITLPAAIIYSFCSFEKDTSLYWLILIGFGGNLLMYGVGFLITLHRSRADKALYTLTCPGYNIGAFTLPFVQTFMSSSEVIATCMFDAGNSIMCTGGSYALSSALLDAEGSARERLTAFVKKLFSSVPFDVYFLMLLLTVFNIRLPGVVASLTEPAAQANGFVAMFMIGLMFRFEAKREYLKNACIILVLRYASATILALLCWYCLPFSQMVRQTLVIVLFSPSTVLAPVFTRHLGGDDGLSSCVSSISIIISVVIMTSLTMALHVAA